MLRLILMCCWRETLGVIHTYRGHCVDMSSARHNILLRKDASIQGFPEWVLERVKGVFGTGIHNDTETSKELTINRSGTSQFFIYLARFVLFVGHDHDVSYRLYVKTNITDILAVPALVCSSAVQLKSELRIYVGLKIRIFPRFCWYMFKLIIRNVWIFGLNFAAKMPVSNIRWHFRQSRID